MGMNPLPGPLGDIESLSWKNVGPHLNQPIVEVRFIGPGGEEHVNQVPNGNYTEDNRALQLLAALGLKPSDVDGTRHDTNDESLMLPVAESDGEFYLADRVFEGGKQILLDADWFEPDEGTTIEVEPAPTTEGSNGNPKA